MGPHKWEPMIGPNARSATLAEGTTLFRTHVPGGWLYMARTPAGERDPAVALSFVPDVAAASGAAAAAGIAD